ncbi:tRNA (adenosine(37)-N6)-threonylcarbamoyltransferase complex ATPase subunit type 1 TsaE [Calditrichota bacterium]
MDVSFISNSAEDTIQFGREFAKGLEIGDVIALAGDLGSGKTMLVKGICLGLGFGGEVTSPSFVKIHHYTSDPPMVHADFYLVDSYNDVMDLGLDELFGSDNISVVEWAQKFPEQLPQDAWWIEIDHVVGREETRRIKIRSGTRKAH